MANIVFCWELGAGYGHIARLLPLALNLKARGHHPVFVVRDLGGAERLLTPHGIRAYQAPLWLGKVQGLPDPYSYAELLMRFGFLDAQALTGVARAWRHLIELLAPDLLVLDHAPTALLATRGMGVPRLQLGDGFCIPPDAAPLPPFAWWTSPNRLRLADSERHALATANTVLRTLGSPDMTRLAELHTCDATFMAAFKEMDHYLGAGVPRPDTDFCGPIFDLGQGAEVDWPGAPGPRIFAYLKPGYAGLEAVLNALRQTQASILVHVAGASRKTYQSHSLPHMAMSAEPLDMEAVRHSCDLVVTHGGAGTTAAALLAGKPLALLPMQMEQRMSARLLSQQGVAVSTESDQLASWPRQLKKALSDDTLRERAQAFAQQHAGYNQTATIEQAVARCEALLRAH